MWEVLELAGLADLTRRDTERFVAEYREAVEPYLDDETAERQAREMSDCVRIAYFAGNLSRLASYQRQQLLAITRSSGQSLLQLARVRPGATCRVPGSQRRG